MQTRKLVSTLAGCTLSLAAITCEAGHYVPGVEGINGAVVPPPGVYYRGYGVHYNADDHNSLPANSEVTVNALANRLVWITDTKILGGDLGFETIIPLIDTDLNIGGGAVKDDDFGLGDVFIGGVLGWHGERWDSVAALGYWSDVGDDDSPAAPGLGYGEWMLTLGANFHLNATKDLSLSLLSRYEIPEGNRDEEFVLEWGVGKRLPSGLNLGVSGYDRWNIGGGENEKHAIGLEASYFWPSVMMGLNAAFYNEYKAEHDFEGNVFRLTLTKVF